MRLTSVCWGLSILVSAAIAAPAAKGADFLPNFVFILADDQAWNAGLSVPMAPGKAFSRSREFHTPNLERLAAQGVTFSQAYASHCKCECSCASILTGRTTTSLNATDKHSRNWKAPASDALANALKRAALVPHGAPRQVAMATVAGLNGLRRERRHHPERGRRIERSSRSEAVVQSDAARVGIHGETGEGKSSILPANLLLCRSSTRAGSRLDAEEIRGSGCSRRPWGSPRARRDDGRSRRVRGGHPENDRSPRHFRQNLCHLHVRQRWAHRGFERWER